MSTDSAAQLLQVLEKTVSPGTRTFSFYMIHLFDGWPFEDQKWRHFLFHFFVNLLLFSYATGIFSPGCTLEMFV